MEGAYNEKYTFIGEWYDSQASLLRRFNIFYYPSDNSMEMYDIKNRKKFVRRVKIKGIKLEYFYIGCTLNILGRLVKIVDFGCEDTRNKLHQDLQVTFVMIKPLPTKIVGKVVSHLYNHGLRVTKMKKARLTTDDVNYIYRHQLTDQTYPFLLEHLNGNMVYGLELVGKNAVELCLKIIGDSDPSKAEPGTIRGLYGTDPVRNCIHAATNSKIAIENTAYFFPSASAMPRSTRLSLTATLSNCTLCIVKPSAVRDGLLGQALEAIDDGGFDVTALNMTLVENINAEEFYEVYKGIVPEYKGMVEELSSGPCVAMEIVSKDPSVNSAVEFRKLVGPSDPEIARLLRPHTLRAKLGQTKVKNAVHCSDLPEDGLLEVEYFFKILDM